MHVLLCTDVKAKSIHNLLNPNVGITPIIEIVILKGQLKGLWYMYMHCF